MLFLGNTPEGSDTFQWPVIGRDLEFVTNFDQLFKMAKIQIDQMEMRFLFRGSNRIDRHKLV